MRKTLSTLTLLTLLTTGVLTQSWVDVPYSASTYSAPGGAWLVRDFAQTTYRYTITNSTLHISLSIHFGVVLGSPPYLEITLPNNWVATHKTTNAISIVNDNIPYVGYIYAEPNYPKLRIIKLGAQPFTQGDSIIEGQITLEVR